MKKFLFALLFAGAIGQAFGQLNMTLLDQIDYTQNLNDVWGWVDPDDGTEYALVGTVTGVSVVSLADPSNAVEVAFLPGANSTWRDIKTWGDYAYVINETSGGLMVINLTNAPGNITATNWSPNLPGLGNYTSSHNIYIDEFGYAYIAGANVNSGGMLIVDVFTTPGTPIFVAPAPATYAHDVYVRDNKMYASEIYGGNLTIYDVSNKMNITTLGQQPTPYLFTHNAWLNDAGDVVFTTDEKANAPIGVYDISDLSNIQELDQFRPIATLGANVIPHNVHVWQDWLIISYYTDGGIIADASRPENVIEVGNWDSFLGGNGGFSGAWGAYPFLPSGLVLLTDIGNGLFVCGATYVRACWLEGTVTDAVTGLPIAGASAHIASTQANAATTGLDGVYKTGQAIAGDFDVTYSANGYISKTVSATLDNGVLTIVDVELEPLSSFTFSGQTVKATDGSPVGGAQVVLQNGQAQYTTVSDGSGNFNFPGVFGGDYSLYAGAWGYVTTEIAVTIGSGTTPPVVELAKGYYDDFALDFGWETSGNASTGAWELGEPVGTDFNGQQSNPDFDIPGDFGDQCYVTCNAGGGAGDCDIDGGTVTLTSPMMDLSTYNQPVLKYTAWFFNAGGSGTPNDNFEIRISNGTDVVTLENITQSGSVWRPESEFDLASLIPITSTMQVSFIGSDLAPGHISEAAVDGFKVEDTSPYPIFSASTTQGCLPETIQFFDSSDTTFLWEWTFEGGTPATSTEQNPTVVYNTPGTFDVSLTVTTQTATVYTIDRPNLITIGQAPVAGFTNTVGSNVIAFTNGSVGASTYAWDFGDGNTSSQANPSNTYTATGLYPVTLTVTNACGSDTFTQDVQVLAVPPTATFTLSGTNGCAPFTVDFTSAPVGNPDTYSWTFPGGTPSSSTDPNPTVVYNTVGTFSVQLTVTNPAGTNTASLNQGITVGASPSALFSFGVAQYNATFTNGSAGATSYVWTFGDGNSSTEANPTHTYAANGQYEVTLEATNECGFAVFTQTVNINVSGTEFLDEAGYSLNASPNPFSHQLMVSYELPNESTTANLLIFNVLGEQVGDVALSGNVGNAAIGEKITGSGVYFIRLQVDGKMGRAVRVVKM
ncbi:MAG: choice-of-anchor B family protein [Saprospiraceae bacterium]|nr:choice-of-anchor B family protein [Saprospiraceae bacterium]MCF8250661.1 choice-of-anchor B family protein [Saprospiraceae bacterium]MCF8280799.1 choice-of-anchor B family protein [Bacteroidales bacterium]MCF8312513.1 choice-of-anchor B family protein [Saprospiraceae bacterium]MCF8440807.1 choice-of-anchor B family protein [Saprospiraceae bacterium]